MLQSRTRATENHFSAEPILLDTGTIIVLSIKVKKLDMQHCSLPLETKNTQNLENRRLGLIESLHMQHCSLRGCIRPLAPA